MSHAHFTDTTITPAHPISPSSAPTYEQIVAEVSARLVEIWEMNHSKTYSWLRRILAISQLQNGEAALYWYLYLQSGDFAAMSDSMRVIGAKRNRSKQAVQQELERATADIVTIYPELASAIHEMRRSIKRYA